MWGKCVKHGVILRIFIGLPTNRLENSITEDIVMNVTANLPKNIRIDCTSLRGIQILVFKINFKFIFYEESLTSMRLCLFSAHAPQRMRSCIYTLSFL